MKVIITVFLLITILFTTVLSSCIKQDAQAETAEETTPETETEHITETIEITETETDTETEAETEPVDTETTVDLSLPEKSSDMSYDTARLSKLVLSEILEKGEDYGSLTNRGERVMIEFSGPNTNKPQHLGHLRNNGIGESMSRLLKKAGYDVVKVNIINDRGIHICKSIQRFDAVCA